MFSRSLAAVGRDHFHGEALRELANRRLGILRVVDFMSPRECLQLLSRLDLTLLREYNPQNYVTQAFRLGPSLNDYRASGGLGDPYWRDVERSLQLWGSLEIDVHSMLLSRLDAAWPGVVRPARIGGREVGWGIVRRMNVGTLVHWDDVRSEMPGLLDEEITGQLSLNVHLTSPGIGGHLSVWARERRPEDEAHRYSYGYSCGDSFPGEASVSVRPHMGNGVFFCPENYHAVAKVESGDRLALSLFLGLCSDGDLVLWA